jgi:hypothetical protein
MRKHTLRLVSATILAVVSVGCGLQPSEPLTPPPGEPLNPPPLAPTAPPEEMDNVIGTFERVTPSWHPGPQSYILHNDSTFALVFPTLSARLSGRFSRVRGALELSYAITDSWKASATLFGDTLTVYHNETMLMADFEDGVYVRR